MKLIFSVLTAMACLLAAPPTRAEVYLPLPNLSRGVSIDGLGLQRVGEPRLMTINGLKASVEIYQTTLGSRALSDVIEHRLWRWFDETQAGAPVAVGADALFLPFRVNEKDYVLTGLLGMAPAKSAAADGRKEGGDQAKSPFNSITFLARDVPAQGTELTVTRYAGSPTPDLFAPERREGSTWALDGEKPVMTFDEMDKPGSPKTVIFEGNWQMEERASRRVANLIQKGFAVRDVDRDGNDVAISADGEDVRIQGFLSADPSGIVTEVISVLHR